MQIIIYILLSILFGVFLAFILEIIFEIGFGGTCILFLLSFLICFLLFNGFFFGQKHTNSNKNRVITEYLNEKKYGENQKDKYIEKVKYDLDIKSDDILKQDKFILVIDEKKVELEINVDTVKYIKDSTENPYLLLNKISNEDNKNTKYELLEVHY